MKKAAKDYIARISFQEGTEERAGQLKMQRLIAWAVMHTLVGIPLNLPNGLKPIWVGIDLASSE